MAYLRSFETMCRECNRKPATVQLFDQRNSDFGKYCKVCGKRALKNLQEMEDTARASSRAENEVKR